MQPYSVTSPLFHAFQSMYQPIPAKKGKKDGPDQNRSGSQSRRCLFLRTFLTGLLSHLRSRLGGFWGWVDLGGVSPQRSPEEEMAMGRSEPCHRELCRELPRGRSTSAASADPPEIHQGCDTESNSTLTSLFWDDLVPFQRGKFPGRGDRCQMFMNSCVTLCLWSPVP